MTQMWFEIQYRTQFYYGSMYISYGVGIAVAVAVYVPTLVFRLDLGPLALFMTIVAALVLTMPYIRAVSKSIWDNFFSGTTPK